MICHLGARWAPPGSSSHLTMQRKETNMTQIFLGYPPEHIKNWIIEHSKPAGNPKTKITFTDGSIEEYDWSGEITKKTLVDAGLLMAGEPTWLKRP